MSRHLLREIERLKRTILALSTLAEDSVRDAMRAVATFDGQLAQRVIDADIDIDNLEVEVEEECLKILALYQPVAADLRFVVAVLKMNSDLERVGDLAVNIAERATILATSPRIELPFDYAEMAEKTQSMLRMSLDALMTMDAGLAHAVHLMDDEVDDINREMYVTVQERTRKNPEEIEALINYLTVSRHLERIADYATNIAEDVIYLIDGQIIRHKPEATKYWTPRTEAQR